MTSRHSVMDRLVRPRMVIALAVLTVGLVVASDTTRGAATDGALSIHSEPAGAAVYVNGRFIGQTPLTVPALAAGDHRVRIVKDGYLENSRIIRVTAGRAKTLQLRLTSRGPQSASNQADGLRIVVIEGEDAVNIIQQKTAVRPIVEVRDRNNLPVAGATVQFTLGGSGGASFAGGAQTITVTTNAAGRAAITELNPIGNGPLQIRVDATYQGQSASTTINQTNFATKADATQAGRTTAQNAAGAGGGLSKAAIAGIVGGITAGTIVGVQRATANQACTFSVSPASLTAGGAAATFTVSVAVAPANCDPATWTATSNAAFITVTGGSGTGNGSFTVNVSANTGAQRTGTVTVADQTVTVTQGAPCSFTVAPLTFNAPATGATLTATVTVAPAGCSPPTWTASSNAAFITVSPANGTGNGTVTLSVGANTGAQRNGTVSIAGQTVTVVQSEVARQCNEQNVAGGDIPDTRTIELGRTAGTFTFSYDTANIEDRMVVSYQGQPLFDSGCLGTDGTRTQTITYSGASTTITVQVTPNCLTGGSGTFWEFRVSCPQ